MNEEVWKDVPGYEGLYQVSTLGQVKSLHRVVIRERVGRVTHPFTIRGRILKPGLQGSGHMFVNLSKENQIQSFGVHRLVLTAFVGPCPDGMEGCHNDGDPSNNCLENLRWDTHRNNQRDMQIHGTANFIKGRRHQNALLTKEDGLEIQRKYATGRYTKNELGEEYECSAALISNIITGKSWHCRN